MPEGGLNHITFSSYILEITSSPQYKKKRVQRSLRRKLGSVSPPGQTPEDLYEFECGESHLRHVFMRPTRSMRL
ncbi:hypothetical protein NQZ68_028897 [Dissostichus eleginoides]|nr:hypothetical protein NQZ68_028897 [Dissostichus eleginoides]